MPLYQSVIFQQAGGQGWSNVFYIQAADHAAAMASLQTLNTDLLLVQADKVETIALRVSDVELKGDGLPQAPSSVNGGIVTAADPMIDASVCAHLEFLDATFAHRVHHYVHGLTKSEVELDGSLRQSLVTAYRTSVAMVALVSYIQANTMNWEKRTIPPVTNALTASDVKIRTSIRRVGRPFGLPVGHRRTA